MAHQKPGLDDAPGVVRLIFIANVSIFVKHFLPNLVQSFMKKFIILLLFSCVLNEAFSQGKDMTAIADSITREGKALYRSEFASWYGTDIFTAKCKHTKALAAGYFSYDNGHGLVNVFFSKEPQPKVLATTTFGYDLDAKRYSLDTTARVFTPVEKDLYTIRKRAIERINKDTIFKTYSNSELNPVPIIVNGVKKVYVLTGTSANGVVLFGNDYLVSFDEGNNIISAKKMHKGLIVSEISRDSTKIQVSGMHNHLPEYSEFITSTDICTLMLYEKFTNWNQYSIISKDYMSMWDCKTNQLLIITMEEWKKRDHLNDALRGNDH